MSSGRSFSRGPSGGRGMGRDGGRGFGRGGRGGGRGMDEGPPAEIVGTTPILSVSVKCNGTISLFFILRMKLN